jgi:hypothetical protein
MGPTACSGVLAPPRYFFLRLHVSASQFQTLPSRSRQMEVVGQGCTALTRIMMAWRTPSGRAGHASTTAARSGFTTS